MRLLGIFYKSGSPQKAGQNCEGDCHPLHLQWGKFIQSEAVILTLVYSFDRKEREFGVAKILEKKACKEYGHLGVQPLRTTGINLFAT